MSTTSTLSQLHLPNSLISGISEMIGSALPAAVAPVAAPVAAPASSQSSSELVSDNPDQTSLENLRFESSSNLWSCQTAQLLVFTYCDKPAMYHLSPLLLCANANATFPRFKRNPSNASIPIWLRTRTYYHLASARIERCNFGEWFQILRRKKTISFGYYLLDIVP